MTKPGNAFDESQYKASSAPELIAALQTKMTQIRVLHAELLDIVAEIDRERIIAVTGYTRLPHLLAETLRITPKQARRLVDEATLVTQTLTPTGHTTPAALPTTRIALHEGLLDGDHLDAIATTLKDLPNTAPMGTRELVESTLAQAARTLDAHAVREHGKILLNQLDQDGPAPPDDDTVDTVPVNTFSYRIARNGRMPFTGDLEPETAAIFEQMLHRETTPDPRPTRERYGDTAADLIHRAANPTGGAKARLTVFLDHQTLINQVGTATLNTGCTLTPEALRRLACDADFTPMALNSQSVPLDAGRTRRLITTKQRDALIARDRGCAYPGCCAPATWTDAHHIPMPLS